MANPSYVVESRGFSWDPIGLDWVPNEAGGGTGADVAVTNWPASTAVTGPLTNAELRAAAVPVVGSVSVGNWPSTQPISGAVSVSNFPASQPVTGAFYQATQPVSLAAMPSTPVTGTFWQNTQPVSGTFWQATQPVSVASMPSTPVTGTFWQATQPVSLASLPALAAGANLIGMVTVREAGTHWAVNHVPAAATIATITQAAAGAGVKNVCTSITVSLSSAAAPTVAVVQFVLRDGAAGAGAIRWSAKLSLPATAGAAANISVPVWIEGTANTAMTLETTGAPPANVQATVSLAGTTV